MHLLELLASESRGEIRLLEFSRSVSLSGEGLGST